MEYVRKAGGFVKYTYNLMAKDPPRTLRVLSAISGVLLILSGILGVLTINPLSMVLSLYNFLFGVLIVLTELKSWPIIRTFQKNVDIYFHLLSIPRGKGGFYCFIGFLAFFSSDWSAASVCVLIVAIVGFIHLFSCERCGAQTDEEANEHGAQPMNTVDSGPDSWGGIMKQVVAENPAAVAAGLSTIASTASAFNAASRRRRRARRAQTACRSARR